MISIVKELEGVSLYNGEVEGGDDLGENFLLQVRGYAISTTAGS
jgi:hypothetical protein